MEWLCTVLKSSNVCNIRVGVIKDLFGSNPVLGKHTAQVFINGQLVQQAQQVQFFSSLSRTSVRYNIRGLSSALASHFKGQGSIVLQHVAWKDTKRRELVIQLETADVAAKGADDEAITAPAQPSKRQKVADGSHRASGGTHSQRNAPKAGAQAAKQGKQPTSAQPAAKRIRGAAHTEAEAAGPSRARTGANSSKAAGRPTGGLPVRSATREEAPGRPAAGRRRQQQPPQQQADVQADAEAPQRSSLRASKAGEQRAAGRQAKQQEQQVQPAPVPQQARAQQQAPRQRAAQAANDTSAATAAAAQAPSSADAAAQQQWHHMEKRAQQAPQLQDTTGLAAGLLVLTGAADIPGAVQEIRRVAALECLVDRVDCKQHHHCESCRQHVSWRVYVKVGGGCWWGEAAGGVPGC